MTWRERIRGRLLLSWALAAVLLVAISAGSIRSARQAAHREVVLARLQGAVERLQTQGVHLQAALRISARRPDLCSLAQPRSAGREGFSFSVADLAELFEAEVVALLSADGTVITEFGGYSPAGLPQPIPAALRAHLTSPAFRERLRSSSEMWGLLGLPQGPLMIALAPIVPPGTSSEPCGTLLVARRWKSNLGAPERKDASEGTPAITLAPISHEHPIGPHAWIQIPEFPRPIPVHWDVRRGQILAAGATLEDVYGQPSLRLIVASALPSPSRFPPALLLSLGLLALVVAATLATRAVERTLFSPLAGLARECVALSQHGKVRRVQIAEPPELAEIAAAVNVVTDRWAADRHQAAQATRAWKVITACTDILFKGKDENETLRGVCRALVELGEYRFVWIGFVEHDEARTVRPVAQAGQGRGYLEAIRVSWGDNIFGHGPTGRAIRSHEPVVCRQIGTDPAFAPWRAEAQRRGFESSAAIPLVHDTVVWGTLNVYSGHPDVFDTQEVEWLATLAQNLANWIAARRNPPSPKS